MMKGQTIRHSGKRLTAAIAIVAGLYFGREILVPLAFAVTLALILTPIVNNLVRLHMRRAIAALIVVLVIFGLVAGAAFVIFNQLVQVATELPLYQENIDNKIHAIRSPSKGALGKAAENVQEISKQLSSTDTPPAGERREPEAPPQQATKGNPSNPLPVQVVPGPSNALDYIRGVLKSFLAPVGTLCMVLIFTIFLLIEQEDLRSRFFRLAGLHRINIMGQALADATARVSRYLLIQFAVNMGFGVVCGAGLYILGLPYAALWGAVAAIFRLIPYVGSTMAALLPAMLALAVYDSWTRPALVLLIFVVLELIIANALEPWLYGRHTGISALALLVTTVFWTVLWGPAGLVLSTPLTVCLVVLGRYLPQFSFLHILLGDEPPLASDAQLYERLLAMDDHGVRSVVEKHLEQSSLAHLYDSVVVPALAMVERERRKEALDSDREEFIFVTVRELLADLAESASGDARPREIPKPRGRVICLPAVHESDEISAAMLAQLLETSGQPTITVPGGLRLDHLAHLSPMESDLLVVSAGAPFAFVKTRTLIGQLKRRFPNTKVALGLWGYTRDPKRLLDRFHSSQPDQTCFTLQSALDSISGVDAEQKPETVEPAHETAA